jgi:hypothetical protein
MSQKFTEAQLEDIGTQVKVAFEAWEKAWKLAMQGMSLASANYSRICRAGSVIQAAKGDLRSTAKDQFNWDAEKMQEVFGSSENYVIFN